MTRSPPDLELSCWKCGRGVSVRAADVESIGAHVDFEELQRGSDPYVPCPFCIVTRHGNRYPMTIAIEPQHRAAVAT